MSEQQFVTSDSAAQGLPQGAHGRHGMLANYLRAASALAGQLSTGTPRALMFLAVGAAAAAVALMFASNRHTQPPQFIQQAAAPASVLSTPATNPAAATQFAALEGRILALEAALAERGSLVAEDAARTARLASDTATQAASQTSAALAQARPQDRLVPALLNLQMVAATARPWHRELRALLDLDAGGHIPPPVVEVLTSHSLRGVSTEGELHYRFVALTPAIAWRMPAENGVLDRAQLNMRAALSGIGLVAPPPPGEADVATASIVERLRHGDLAGAVADTAALDKRAEPLLAGWMAQARARLAVEQALRETILTLLARTPPQ